MVFDSIKDGFSRMFGKSDMDSEYVEIDLGPEMKKTKVIVRPFMLKQFEDVNEILNALREGYTIAVVDIKPLKQKDLIEVKRAIATLEKTADALEGNIAGFGDNTIIVTPQFAEIFKGSQIKMDSVQEKRDKLDKY